MHTIQAKNILLGFLFLLLLLQSCANENEFVPSGENNPQLQKIAYRLSIPQSNDAIALEEEMMKTILLVIVHSDGTVESLEEIAFSTTQEAYELEAEVTSGKKRVYGFSNLTDGMKGQAGLSSLTVGSPMPDLSLATLTLPNGYEIDGSAGNYLPMSNTTEITVSTISGQVFTMELIRVLSKVEFTFRNETGNEVTLNQLVFTPLTTSPIFLMPGNGDSPVLPSGTIQGDYTYNFGTTYTFSDGQELEYSTYVNESVIQGNGWFQIRLITQTGTGGTTEERIALTELTSLNRNDYLKIPIILSDYKLELDVRSYPPIGGYPAAVIYENDAYHITFSGGGPFVIVPRLLQLSTQLEIEIDDADWNFTYEDTAPSFFEEQPVLKDGEIYGIIEPAATGSVLFTLSAGITTSAGIQRVITYKIYITQN